MRLSSWGMGNIIFQSRYKFSQNNTMKNLPIITLKIDVTKIEKQRLFKGEKGTYLDVILLPAKDNQYGDDYMVCQRVTKEEREAGKRGAILGNARCMESKGGESNQTPKSNPNSGQDFEPPF